MSTVKTNNVQIGQSLTATNNFTWYQPSTPDGTVRLGNGNSGSVSDVITVGTTGNLTFANSVSLSAASTKTLTLNGGAGSNGLVLDASNNVGIGVSPGAKLDVNYTGSPSNNSEIARLRWNTSGAVAGNSGDINFTNSSAVVIGKISNLQDSAGTALGFWNYSNAAGTAAEKMRLDSSGNLGLGVTPSAWRTDVSFKAIQTPGGSFTSYIAGGLDQTPGIAANAYVDSGGTWRYINSRAASWYIQNGGMHAWYTAPSGTAGSAISFTQAMTLDASGNLLVGTTSSSTGNGGFRIRVNNSGISGYTNVQTESPTNSNTYSTWDIYAAGAYRFYVGYAGTISAVSTTITGISDQRLKENIRDLDDGLAAILSLKPRKFDWKEGKGKDIKNDRGFIAQEFEQVFPDMIESWADPAPEGEEPYKAINANLIPTLVKAIQELSAELNELKQKVNA